MPLFYVKMKHPLIADEPFEVVADRYRAYTRGRTGENKVTLAQGDVLRNEHQDVFEGENQLSGIPLLYRLTVFIQPEREVIQIAERVFGVQSANRG